MKQTTAQLKAGVASTNRTYDDGGYVAGNMIHDLKINEQNNSYHLK